MMLGKLIVLGDQTNLIVTHGKKYKFFSECLKGAGTFLSWRGYFSQKTNLPIS